MKPTLIEIKARCNNPKEIETILLKNKAQFIGIDHQIDTYFNVKNGRLKLRQGNIECHLIFYNRNNQAGPKQSNVMLYKPQDAEMLREILLASNGEKVTIDKYRKIFFIDNVKFHIDRVEDLGGFIEIEAIDKDGSIGTDILEEQCLFYMKLLAVKSEDLMTNSYSDMLLEL